jgi:hypothetical protein
MATFQYIQKRFFVAAFVWVFMMVVSVPTKDWMMGYVYEQLAEHVK